MLNIGDKVKGTKEYIEHFGEQITGEIIKISDFKIHKFNEATNRVVTLDNEKTLNQYWLEKQ